MISSVRERTDPNAPKPEPYRVNILVYISSEGRRTETSYFKNVSKAIAGSGIVIKPIEKGDKCGLNDVINELLKKEQQRKRSKALWPAIEKKAKCDSKFQRCLNSLRSGHTLSQADQDYVEKVMPELRIEGDFQAAKESGYSEGDYYFAVVDRDKETHTEIDLRNCQKICEDHQYRLCLTNPCFEFYLLMHLEDLSSYDEATLAQIKENKRVSSHHSFVSNRLSQLAHHAKTITERTFRQNYLDNYPKAKQQLSQLASDFESLLNNIGSNVPTIFDTVGIDIGQDAKPNQ